MREPKQLAGFANRTAREARRGEMLAFRRREGSGECPDLGTWKPCPPFFLDHPAHPGENREPTRTEAVPMGIGWKYSLSHFRFVTLNATGIPDSRPLGALQCWIKNYGLYQPHDLAYDTLHTAIPSTITEPTSGMKSRRSE